MRQIKMVDLAALHRNLSLEIETAIHEVIDSTSFINGAVVNKFCANFAKYLGTDTVIGCGNGTDAIQVALMALGLSPGDEVILPSFNYVAAAEVVALLNLKPVFADVDPLTFSVSVEDLKSKISDKTRAVIAVHLFGQCADLESLREVCDSHSLFLIEDAAQSIGASYFFSDGINKKSGTVGHIGTTSFFPSKNLGCMGDGGAIFTNDPDLGERIRKICNHGQGKKYSYEMIGVNSRLDSIQAAVLDVKLKYLDQHIEARRKAADVYDQLLRHEYIQIPYRINNGFHSFNQYTIKLTKGRDKLREFLLAKGIPTMVYYPGPLHLQQAYRHYADKERLPVSEQLPSEVLSLPMHPELDAEQQAFICENLLVGLKQI